MEVNNAKHLGELILDLNSRSLRVWLIIFTASLKGYKIECLNFYSSLVKLGVV